MTKKLSDAVIKKLVGQGNSEEIIKLVHGKTYKDCYGSGERWLKRNLEELIESEERLKNISMEYLIKEAKDGWKMISCRDDYEYGDSLGDVLDKLLKGLEHLISIEKGKGGTLEIEAESMAFGVVMDGKTSEKVHDPVKLGKARRRRQEVWDMIRRIAKKEGKNEDIK